ncbi:MAG: ATP-binding cassette domain-containing protein [Acidobacteria bacterium]|nr:ATP-binding cassette domain-containing protein [Acidobacteriota bacterium]
MTRILEIQNATIYRGENLVFERLNLRIDEGCHTALLGPNGAGKTTLMKLLAREVYPVLAPDSAVRIFGSEDWNVWDLRAHLGIVSGDLQQEYLPHTSGLKVILSGLYSSIDLWPGQVPTPEQRTQAEQILQELGVSELRDRPFGEMSTGQQRRLLLGRALIHRPAALLLDEPTTGLDLKACFQYLQTVRELMRAGTTVILVTQHIHEIPPEIGRVILLRRGAVVADGAKDTVLSSARLSELFDIPVQVVEADGFYQAVPREPVKTR